jgi:hypothetical protein
MNMFSLLRLAGALLATATALAGAEATAIVERPAPTRPAPALRPGYDIAQVLNAIIADQLAAQNRPDQSNPYRVPRPRPDREQLTIAPPRAG